MVASEIFALFFQFETGPAIFGITSLLVIGHRLISIGLHETVVDKMLL